MFNREKETEQAVSDLQKIYMDLHKLRITYNLPQDVELLIEDSYHVIENVIKELMPPARLTCQVKDNLLAISKEYKYMVRPTPYSVVFGVEKPIMIDYTWVGGVEIDGNWAYDIPLRVDRVVDIKEFIERKKSLGYMDDCTEGK